MLASQAENANKRRGEAKKLVISSCKAHSDSATNKESIIPSRQRRAERRCVRWNTSPANPKIKVAEKAK